MKNRKKRERNSLDWFECVLLCVVQLVWYGNIWVFLSLSLSFVFRIVYCPGIKCLDLLSYNLFAGGFKIKQMLCVWVKFVIISFETFVWFFSCLSHSCHEHSHFSHSWWATTAAAAVVAGNEEGDEDEDEGGKLEISVPAMCVCWWMVY